MHLGALVELPPHDNAAVTHNCPDVNAPQFMVTLELPFPLMVAVPGLNVQL